jgi:hypothetical protein
MSITSPSVDQSSTVQQSPTPSAMGNGAVGGHHHHHGGGGSEFATLLADLTDSTQTDPTAGADSSVLTATSGADPTGATSSPSDPLLSALGAGTTAGDSASPLGASIANSGATGLGSTDPSALSSLLSELDVNSTTL